jgi:hypothetical protein
MLSTQMKDTKGNELFEGDTILLTYPNGGREELNTIFYDKDQGAFRLKNEQGATSGMVSIKLCNGVKHG